jgi:hypothetical protein
LYLTLENELEIPRDKFNLIINDLCRNFVKKYERNINIDANSLSLDLKSVIKNIEVYSQCIEFKKYTRYYRNNRQIPNAKQIIITSSQYNRRTGNDTKLSFQHIKLAALGQVKL